MEMASCTELENKKIIQKFKKKFKINFKDPAILLEALTHESFLHERKIQTSSYEKLEFLGDTVLNLIISDYLYEKHPFFTVGQLAKNKSRLISQSVLTILGKKMKLGTYLFMGKGEETCGGRKKDSIISDAFEALVGAIYLDQGLEKAKHFILHNFTEILEEINIKDTDCKTALQEYFQKKYKKLPVYKLVKESGPAHKKVFAVGVWFKEKKLGTGKGSSIKSAHQAAARAALKKYAT